MGNIYSSYSSYDFDVISNKIISEYDMVLINTLPDTQQGCLIKTTIKATKETEYINELYKINKKKEIVIYGKNHRDLKIIEKYNQLKKLGFTNVHIYFGGLFEWLLLKEYYGEINFPIDGKMGEISQYK
jgi:3-mercaptopyruvate sulfurtransferase SseA